eukprot:scaffold5364_cov156-Skeletonema_menzelii.AAC.10
MQDALAKAIQENSLIESGKNEEVYLLSEHGLAKKHLLSEQGNILFQASEREGTIASSQTLTKRLIHTFFVADNEGSVYFTSPVTFWSGKLWQAVVEERELICSYESLLKREAALQPREEIGIYVVVTIGPGLQQLAFTKACILHLICLRHLITSSPSSLA